MEFLFGLSGVLASILGLVLAIYAVFVNGKMTKEILKKMDEKIDLMREYLVKMDERLEKMDLRLEKMDEKLEKMDLRLEKMDERLEKMDERSERISQILRYVADLVKAESEKIIQKIKE
ncbi:MAG: hypothetical protein ABIN73_00580 [candidate division WOR-3 bacterium]